MAAEIVDLTLALIDDVLLGEERVASWLSSCCLDVLWPLGGAPRGGEGGKAWPPFSNDVSAGGCPRGGNGAVVDAPGVWLLSMC